MQICYVIINPNFDGWVKIGFTSKSNMESRLRAYQTCSPFRDYVVFHKVLFKDAKLAEQMVLQRLRDECVFKRNEWFKINKKIASNIIDSVYEEIEI